MTRNSNGTVTVYVENVRNSVTIAASAVKSGSTVTPTIG